MSGGNDESVCEDIVLIIIAIFIPPLAVFLKAPADEKCGGHFWLNILLCILGVIPGLLHAIWYVVAK